MQTEAKEREEELKLHIGTPKVSPGSENQTGSGTVPGRRWEGRTTWPAWFAPPR